MTQQLSSLRNVWPYWSSNWELFENAYKWKGTEKKEFHRKPQIEISKSLARRHNYHLSFYKLCVYLSKLSRVNRTTLLIEFNFEEKQRGKEIIQPFRSEH